MSEKVFTKKMTLSICLIILCLCALSISAGAFFSDTSKSNVKTYSTATYDLTITATKQVTTLDENDPPQVVSVNSADTVNPTASDPHIYELALQPVQADREAGYSVTIQIKDGITASASGYCKIVIKDGATTLGTFYTKQIARGTYETGNAIQNSRALTIKTERAITVEFIPLWGTYSGSNGNAINDAAVITVPATGNPSAA